ncbi:hypothetical protein NPIL_487201 [Nephila pilipes]|uniref:Uncharacterized protein n=1 Tax=Nephila pilipes TaxID=299642 RepID=A0A8X6MXX1_NEPPI|nr:hypothetical protein NPIL_487201 [Nephila pilipes]
MADVSVIENVDNEPSRMDARKCENINFAINQLVQTNNVIFALEAKMNTIPLFPHCYGPNELEEVKRELIRFKEERTRNQDFKNHESDDDVKDPSFAPPDLQYDSFSEEETNEEKSLFSEDFNQLPPAPSYIENNRYLPVLSPEDYFHKDFAIAASWIEYRRHKAKSSAPKSDYLSFRIKVQEYIIHGSEEGDTSEYEPSNPPSPQKSKMIAKSSIAIRLFEKETKFASSGNSIPQPASKIQSRMPG